MFQREAKPKYETPAFRKFASVVSLLNQIQNDNQIGIILPYDIDQSFL